MRFSKGVLFFSAALIALSLAACGGGGGSMQAALSGPPPPPPPTPTPTPTPMPSPTPTVTPGPGTGSPLTGPNFGPNGAWGPPAVANALTMPVQSGFDGTGQTVAIIMDAFPSGADLQSYFSYFQIPVTSRSILIESIDGGPQSSNDVGEVTLDSETIASLAPGANVTIYGIPNLDFQSVDDALNQILSDGVASVVSYSAGGCEFSGVTNDSLLADASAVGVALVASSGDTGNECFTPSGLQVGVEYPASDPYVTGVGGTETYIPGFTLDSNQVWNDFTCAIGQCAGGGGVSAYFGIPGYQQGVPGSPASSVFRNVPDVSMPAEFDSVLLNGQWTILDGTSWSAPQYAALMAETYEYCNTRLTPPATIPYYVDFASTGAFIDVVTGNDQFDGTSPYYSATTAYDDASGIGVPLGISFANGLCPNRVPPARVLRPIAVAELRNTPPAILAPPTRGLQDIGRRPALASTRVQFILKKTPDVALAERNLTTVLRQSGFRVVKTFRNHLVVDAEAPSRQVERFFSTQFRNVVEGRFGVRYVASGSATIPISISQYVSTVCLDDVVLMRATPVLRANR